MPLPQLTLHSDSGFVTESQDDKEVESNLLDALLDNAINKPTDFSVTAGGTFNLNTPDANIDLYLESGLIRLTGTPGAPTTIIVLDSNKRIAFFNDSTQSTTIDTVTGAASPVLIAAGATKTLHVRGIEITIVADDATQTGALLADGSVNVTGNFDWIDKQLKRPLLIDYGEASNAPASAASITLNIETGNTFDVTMDQNTTLVFDNPTASGNACSFTLYLRQDGTGGWAVTLPASVRWEAGTPPTLSNAASQYDIISFATINGGTDWHAFLGGKNFG